MPPRTNTVRSIMRRSLFLIGLVSSLIVWILLRTSNASNSSTEILAASKSTYATQRPLASAEKPATTQPPGEQSKQGRIVAQEQNYETTRDLYDFFVQAIASGSRSKTMQAVRVAQECHGFLNSFDRLGVIAGGGTTDPPSDAAQQPQRDAINELVRRCSGFNRMSPIQRRGAISDALSKAEALGAVETQFLSKSSAGLTQSDFETMLQTVSGANFEILLLPLGNLLARNTGDYGNNRDAASMAAYLALCDLSGACGVGSLRALISCAWGGTCNTALDEGWEQGYSEEKQAIIRTLRIKVVNAVRSNNVFSLRI